MLLQAALMPVLLAESKYISMHIPSDTEISTSQPTVSFSLPCLIVNFNIYFHPELGDFLLDVKYSGTM